MKKVIKNIFWISLVAMLMYLLLKDISTVKSQINVVSFSELQLEIEKSKEKVVITENGVGQLTTEINGEIYKTNLPPYSDLVDELIEKEKIEYRYLEKVSFLSILLQYGVPILLIILLLMWMFGGSRGEKESKKHSQKIIQKANIPNVKLEDIGGLNEEAKAEIEQMIEIFKNKEEAIEMGIKPAKGMILHGPPGTGKTKLAKALANGLDATFYATSGSAFSEMFVGVGASRVRELFEEARKTAPSLIFIDEIDSVAKKRGTAHSHEERENTLNELLKQMDGVESNEGVFVVAATNRLDILDEAILRPGRFDHKILIGYPDLEGREEIINIHTKNKKIDEEIKNNLKKIAEDTIGYTGAEIENLFNLAAKKALMKKKKEITMEEINEAIDSTILGNKNKPIKEELVKERVAYHEAGHALIRAVLVPERIRKATILPRGGALGYVATTPKEIELSTKKDLLKEIAVILGGGISEIKKYGEHSIGVSGDVEQVKKIIDKMVAVGMKNDTFKLTFKEKDEKELKEELFNEGKKMAEDVLNQYEDEWESITQLLLEKETVDGQEIQEKIKKN